MSYGLTDSRRRIVENRVQKWLDRDDLVALHRLRISGSGATEKTHVADEPLTAEELQGYTDLETLLDEFVQEHGRRGGKFRWRAVFKDGEDKVQFTVIRLPRELGGSDDRGGAAMSKAVAGALDAQSRRTTEAHDRVLEMTDNTYKHLVDLTQARMVEARNHFEIMADLRVEIAQLNQGGIIQHVLENLEPDQLRDVLLAAAATAQMAIQALKERFPPASSAVLAPSTPAPPPAEPASPASETAAPTD